MKKILLSTLALTICVFFGVSQSSSEVSGNMPVTSGNYDGYIFNFYGTSADNCEDVFVPNGQVSPTYAVDNLGDGNLTFSVIEEKEFFRSFPIRFAEANCSGLHLNLGGTQFFEIKLSSDMDVPNLVILLGDTEGGFADFDPIAIDMKAGDTLVSVSDLDFRTGDGSVFVDSTRIREIRFYIRNGGAPDGTTVNGATITIDYLKIGDQTGLEVLTGVEEDLIEQSLNVFPNPASDRLNVSFDARLSGEVQLLDLNGSIISSSTSGVGMNELTIETKNVTPGIYVLSILGAQHPVTKMVIIE